MTYVKGIVFGLCGLALLSCAAEPAPKREPLKDPKLIRTSGLVTASAEADILFVIDDSGSMAKHQNRLKDNVDLFIQEISAFSFIDFHFGVITSNIYSSSSTKSRNGNLVVRNGRAFVDKSTPNLESEIKEC